MDTIAYFGHHKCASTYIRNVIQHLSQFLDLKTHTDSICSRLPLGYHKRPEQAERIVQTYKKLETKPYDIVCHINADMAVVEAVSRHGPFRGFHVIRDPRDVLISGFYWHLSENSNFKNDMNQWIDERRKRLNDAQNREDALLLEIEFSKCFFTAMAEWNYKQKNIIELKYEDMLDNQLAFFKKALGFVGLPVVNDGSPQRLINKIIKDWKYWPSKNTRHIPKSILKQALVNNSFKQQGNGRSRGEEEIGHKYRKGIAGDWKNHFTPRVKDTFRMQYGQLLIQLGYEKDMNW